MAEERNLKRPGKKNKKNSNSHTYVAGIGGHASGVAFDRRLLASIVAGTHSIASP
jgi:hypothetical protein